MKLLLEAGADPNIADNGGNTPLHLAAQKGNLGVATQPVFDISGVYRALIYLAD